MLSTSTTAIGIFEDHEHAAAAIRDLKDNGFDGTQIGLASKSFSKQFDSVGLSDQHAAEEGAVKGAAIGGGVGAALGLIGAMFIPGLIPMVAGQALVAALLGGAAGAAGGAFAGPFVAMGLSDADAEKHARLVEEGKTVLMVVAPDRIDEADKIMIQNGAYDDSMTSSP